jgi:tellurite resistance protein TehA-like permease
MKPFTTIASILFVLVAILHVLRLIYGWEVTINDVAIPMWVSIIGVFIPAGLAVLLWRESRY